MGDARDFGLRVAVAVARIGAGQDRRDHALAARGGLRLALVVGGGRAGGEQSGGEAGGEKGRGGDGSRRSPGMHAGTKSAAR